jgi:hypothetical protein
MPPAFAVRLDAQPQPPPPPERGGGSTAAGPAGEASLDEASP